MEMRFLYLMFGLVLGIVSFFSISTENTRSLDMINKALPRHNLMTGGQPSINDLQKLAKQGIKVVINLRKGGEFTQFNEKNAVESLGMKYVSIEVSGSDGMSIKNAYLLDMALDNLEQPVLVHCASSNRVGGLLAVWASKFENQSKEESFAFGTKAGMKNTQGKVKKLLGL